MVYSGGDDCTTLSIIKNCRVTFVSGLSVLGSLQNALNCKISSASSHTSYMSVCHGQLAFCKSVQPNCQSKHILFQSPSTCALLYDGTIPTIPPELFHSCVQRPDVQSGFVTTCMSNSDAGIGVGLWAQVMK